MPRTILDITSIQQINLFTKISSVQANNCFCYANQMFFVVDGNNMQRARGPDSSNLKKLSGILKKRVKIIRAPSENEMELFVKTIVQPVKFKRITNEDGNITINAGNPSKASLIGRDHVKLNQLSDILKQYFNVKTVKVI